MTVVHTYFYIVVDTQRGCHNLKKFHETSCSVSRVVPFGQICGRTGRQTNRHDEDISRFPQFCENVLRNNKFSSFLDAATFCK